MTGITFKNNQEAIEHLLRQGGGDDVNIEWPPQRNGGTNKSSYHVIVNGKDLYAVVVEPPEINPAHGITPEVAKLKHEFFATVAQKVEGISIRDNTDNSDNPGLRSTVQTNFSSYIQTNGSTVSTVEIDGVKKAVYITSNYVANDKGYVIEKAHHVNANEAYIYGRAYAGLFERAAKGHKFSDLRKTFGHKDPYSPSTAVKNIKAILKDEERVGCVGVSYIYQKAARQEARGDTMVFYGPELEIEGLRLGKEITSRLATAAESINKEYAKIGNSLRKGLVHGDPWFDNIIQHYEHTASLVGSPIPLPPKTNSIVIDIENSGVGYRAMDIAMTISSMNGLDLKTGKFTDEAKAYLRGADEVKHLEAGFEDKFYLLYATAALYISNMRLDKWSHGDSTKRSPVSEIEKAEEAISGYMAGKKVFLEGILTPPTNTVLKNHPHVAARYGIFVE